MVKNVLSSLFVSLLISACAVENDIPYPIVEGSILAFEVEGQCAETPEGNVQATIDKNKRTIQLFVNDSVDITRLKIKKLTVSNQARILVDSTLCDNYAKFPAVGFESLSTLPLSSNTRMDFTRPVSFILQTYQDYEWRVDIQQVIERNIIFENQVGKAVVDDINRNVVVYLAAGQPLNKVKVSAFDLGGKYGRVVPNLTAPAYYDFSEPVSVFVSHAWEEISYEWTVYVYNIKGEEGGASPTDAAVTARTTQATVKGSISGGKTPQIEYALSGTSEWTTLAVSQVTVNGTSFTATMSGLQPATSYLYRITIDGDVTQTGEFSTAPQILLPNGSFDDWHSDAKLWNPWAANGTSFWDTGNRGATTVGKSNSYPTDETCNGKGQAGLLESKYIIIKFAAGNIFTGSYLRTDGTNGILSFGREFSSFPSKLRVNYKYSSQTINRIGDDDYAHLKGLPDSCHIYIALTDWDQPLEIRTRPSERQLFDKNDPSIIAYAELIEGHDTPSYRQLDLELKYRNERTPKYIVIVASASKYGDFFTGGEGSKLWVDNFELIYD